VIDYFRFFVFFLLTCGRVVCYLHSMTSDSPRSTADALCLSKVTCCRNASGWWVYFPSERNGKTERQRKRLKSEAAARAFAAEIAREIDAYGGVHKCLPPEVRSAYTMFNEYARRFAIKDVELPGFDVFVQKALETLAAEITPTEPTMAEGVEQYLEIRKATMSPAGHQSLRTRLRRVARSMGDRTMRSITATLVDNWLSNLPRQRRPKGTYGRAYHYGLSAHALNHYRSALATFFRYATEVGWVASNPVKAVKREISVGEEPEVYTPDQAARVMWTALTQDPSVLPVLALMMFAGLRLREAAKVDLAVVLSPHAVQSGRFQVNLSKAGPRLVTISDALLAWIEVSPNPSGVAWAGSLDNLRTRLQKILQESRVKSNVMSPRMTYLRHRLQQTGDVAQVATEGGARFALLETLTRISVTTEDAATFFNLNPNLVDEVPSPSPIH